MFPFFNHYPGSDLHEIDLAYILKLCAELRASNATLTAWKNTHEDQYEELKNAVDGLINNLVDVIVPWDSSVAYHIYSIVEYQGTNYIAVKDVPVGVMITNTEYWQPANTVIEQINAIGVTVDTFINSLFYTTPEEHGAVGDGVTDDTAAMIATLEDEKSVILLRNTYKITDNLDINGKTLISFNGASIVITAQNTEREWVILNSNEASSFIGINFEIKCDGKILGLYSTTGVVIRDCAFTAESGHLMKSLLDFYSDNHNAVVSNCRFYHNSTGAGGIWVRNTFSNQSSEDIHFSDCYFESNSGIDEIFAVWGGETGVIDRVTVDNCTFIVNSGASMPHMLSVGMNGQTKNVIFTSCYFENNGAANSILKAVKQTTDVVIDNARFIGCTVESKKTVQTVLYGGLIFEDGTINVHESTRIARDGVVHDNPVIINSIINSAGQLAAMVGEFYDCIFNLNSEVSEGWHITQYGLTLVRCVINGINCTGTFFQIIGTTFPTIIEDTKFFGTLTTRFMTCSQAAVIKVLRSFILDHFNILNANVTGYIVDTFTPDSTIGTIQSLQTHDNVTGFTA